MKPEDRKRLKQHIEMIVEHKEPEEIVRENFKKLQDEVADLREKNIKLRLELHTLRFKEAQENRFIWWIYQVYAKHVSDLLIELDRTTFPVTPFGLSNTVKRLKEYTGHIYDGTYLDTAMSTEPSNSDVSMTEDVLTDVKTGQSIEIEDLETVVEHLKIRLSEWQGVARQLADELVEANSERLPVSWEEPGETSRAMIAYRNLVDIEDMEANDAKQRS